MEKINGKMLAVEVHGEGDALIMVHGLAGTSNAFGPQAGVLARNFTVIRPDLEGSGRSPVKGKLSIAGYAADIVALMKARKIRSAHFVGHSMGTIICQHLAAKAPAKVKTMVLLGPLAEPPEPGRGALRDRAKLARAKGMVPIADALVQASISAATRASRPEIAALVREFVMRQDAEGYARSCEALAAARAAPASKIKCRTLLITGDEDGVAPPAAVRKLAKSIKGARAMILPNCGHWTPIERHEDVNRALLNFYFG